MFFAVMMFNAATIIGVNSLGLFSSVAIGFPVTEAAKLYMIFAVANMIGTASAGLAADKLGPKVVIVIASIAVMIYLLLELFIVDLGNTFMYLCPIFIGWGISWVFVPTQILVGRVFGMKDYGTILGYIMIALSVGNAFFPLYQGAYDLTQSFNLGLIVMLALVVVSMLIMVTLKGSRKISNTKKKVGQKG
jgi:MFS family permease